MSRAIAHARAHLAAPVMERRRSFSRSAPSVRSISMLVPTQSMRGVDDATPAVRDQRLLLFSLAAVATATTLAFAPINTARLLLWGPLSVVLITFALPTLRRLIAARQQWTAMKQRHVLHEHSLEDMRILLEMWRSDYKRGGCQESASLARQSLAAAAGPLATALIVTHGLVLYTTTAMRAKYSATVAALIVDATIAALLYLAGDVTDLMRQPEFLASARLRIAEASYALADVKNLDVRLSLPSLHLYNALQMELTVIETYTR